MQRSLTVVLALLVACHPATAMDTARNEGAFNVPPASGIGSGWAWDAANGYLASTEAGTWSIGIPTVVGWQLKSLTFEVAGDLAADLEGGVFRRPKNSAIAGPDFTFSVSNPGSGFTDELCDIPDSEIADGDSAWVTLTANAPNLRIGEVRVKYAPPTH